MDKNDHRLIKDLLEQHFPTMEERDLFIKIEETRYVYRVTVVENNLILLHVDLTKRDIWKT